jgi:hypothetical protein
VRREVVAAETLVDRLLLAAAMSASTCVYTLSTLMLRAWLLSGGGELGC